MHRFGVVSGDRSHDSAHALYTMRLIEDRIKQENLFNKVTIVSDGPASHFKNRYQLNELCKSPMERSWVFSATGHGKGPCDGVGGVLKHLATKHNLSRASLNVIKNPHYTTSIRIIHALEADVQNFREDKHVECTHIPNEDTLSNVHLPILQ